MKNLLLTNFIFVQCLYAKPEIIITNNSENEIKFSYTYLKKNSYLQSSISYLAPYKSYIGETKRYVLNDNYLLEFIDTHEECSWLSTFGIHHANGWGIKFLLNGEKIVTICANKYNVLDFRNHAELIYTQEQNKIEKFEFKNIGWWQQDKVFKTSFILFLDHYKINYSKNEIKWFIYNGDLDENWQNQARFSLIK